MKRIACFISFLIAYFTLLSQTGDIDSLKGKLTNRVHDTIRSEILMEIAYAYYNTNQDSSIRYFDRAINLNLILQKSKDTEIKEKSTFLYAECLYNKAYLESQIMHYTLAESMFEEAIDQLDQLIQNSQSMHLAERSKKLKAEVIAGIGAIYLDKGYFSIALKNFIESQKIKDGLIKSGFIDESETAGDYFNIGMVHFEMYNYDKAMEYLNKSLQISKDANDSLGMAKCRNNIGLAEFKLNRIDHALKNFELTLEFALKNDIPILQAQVYNNMADCFIRKGDYEKAELYLAKSIIIAQKLSNELGVAYIKLGFSELYIKTKNYKKAVQNAEDAIAISKKYELTALEKEGYEKLYRVFKLMGNYKTALEKHIKFKELEDSLFNKEKTGQIAEMEAKYQAEKKQKEIDNTKLVLAERNAELQKKRNESYIYFGLLLLLFISIVFIYINSKHKQKIAKLIQNQNKRITDSIEYAKRIQTAALPTENLLSQIFREHMVIYKPLQIVSGDFYWSIKKDNFSVFAVADCTGHGVPGGFIGMLGISILNEVSGNFDLKRPDLILEEMRIILKKSFDQKGLIDEQKDGIDIALCSIDQNTGTLYFSAANSLGFLLRKGQIIDLEPVMNPVGIYPKEIPFMLQTVSLEPDDSIYLFTDGYTDQFGGKGSKSKKYTLQRFKELLIKNDQLPLIEQKRIFETAFEEWKNKNVQIDDVLIFAVKI
jgi:serine phosphatase RsbU (regulator of sigma subunit)/Tfp pilus assembly protein PilF